jgi:hypothetical protein
MTSTLGLSVAEQRRIRELVDEHGEVAAAELLGVHRATALRALCGRPVRRATAVYLGLRLRELAAEQPREGGAHGT